MPRRSKEEAERTRQRILASALSLFAQKGYEHTTFNDISARLKLTKGAVYWHFKSKEALLVELVHLALERFHRVVEQSMPKGELTFPAVAKMMVSTAEMLVSDARGCAFFILMHGQLRWTDASMANVRTQLMSDDRLGPKAVFRRALDCDKAAGRVRAGVDSIAVASAATALWDGLVKARIDGFLECDLLVTLENFYANMWKSIQA